MKSLRVYWRFFRKNHISQKWNRVLHYADIASELGERDWKKITLFMIAIAVSGYMLAFLYVFVFGGEDFDKRARAATPFLVGLAAAATFFSVLWRGVITARQVEEAKRANDSKDEIELGLLLEKANELLQKPEERNKTMAIAMLETVATAANDKYSTYALQLISDEVVASQMGVYSESQAIRADSIRRSNQIRKIFRKCAEHSPPRILTDTILFTFSEPSLGTNPFSEKPSFVPISEIPNQFIRGASIKFSDEAIDTMNKAGNRWHFANCVFDNMSSDLSGLRNSHAIEAMDGRFVNCEFKSYKIRPAVSLAGLLGWVLSAPQKCIFRSCDFSSAGLSTVFFKSNSFSGCTYDPARPPELLDETEKTFEEFAQQNDIDVIPAGQTTFGGLFGPLTDTEGKTD